MSGNARHIYTCPGVSKTLFEHYSYNSVILPLPTRCNSHLRLKALDGQFLQLRAHDLLYSKAKYKISAKLQWDQPLVVSVVLFFRTAPFIITALPGKHSQCLWYTQGCILYSTSTQRFCLPSISVKVHWQTSTGKDLTLFNLLRLPTTNKPCKKNN